jgi:hypothetical protein
VRLASVLRLVCPGGFFQVMTVHLMTENVIACALRPEKQGGEI